VVAGGVNVERSRSWAFESTTLEKLDSNEDVTLAFDMKTTRKKDGGEDKVKVKTKVNCNRWCSRFYRRRDGNLREVMEGSGASTIGKCCVPILGNRHVMLKMLCKVVQMCPKPWVRISARSIGYFALPDQTQTGSTVAGGPSTGAQSFKAIHPSIWISFRVVAATATH
jgi:hypothetical protein